MIEVLATKLGVWYHERERRAIIASPEGVSKPIGGGRMRKILALTLIAILAIGVLGFSQPGSSPDEPIYMLLVPSTEGATVEEIGQKIAEAIFDLTGLYISVRG
jgi:hypothetical protein